MSHRGRRRPRRTFRWEGCVDEVYSGSFWARLIPSDHRGPEVAAEFDLRRLPDATPGLLFTVYAHRRGLKRRVVLRPCSAPPWTTEEVAALRRATRARRDRLAELIG